ncbi:hypothetical protein LU631_11235 [Erwinia tracheiphila]|uniref:Uncharacterized protein n=1 Tax=Erwinia tracheiphila TaxID=65700 RepID=A0A0M2K8Y7_9GAMM|nr:hypothetical protein [Erwinia tracheiphila]EOS92592.1 hypothetical protein ETR_23674 [Erwinia tracheiphila PSU-1]KKF34450.1 hypothetical protein SY86_01625 [Erwinia tracheiphila]KKF35498.1 hypothetical protein SY86_08780 [Erwinia tracheiphila]KKF35850.1 hypothetical protein SY86_11085 [Erwinia tracheiphila]UIA86119.1 hypothetical protein LU631_13565 [Erwinia tracheiphila]
MSHFRDLCRLNETVEERRADAARILRNEAIRLIEYYEEWLGLPARHWVDSAGDLHPYVETGLPCNEPEGFSALSVRQIGVTPDGAIRMAVRTWVENEPSGLHVSVVLNLQLASVGDNRVSIDVQVEQDRPVRVLIGKSDENVWEDVVESIKRHIGSALKKRYPPAYL